MGAFPRDAHVDVAAVGRGLHGIHDEVGEDLLDLAGIESSEERPPLVGQAQRDALPLGEWPQELQRVPRHARDIPPLLARTTAPRELEQLADDARHLAGRIDDDPRIVAGLVGRDLARGDHLGASNDDVEGRPELVGHARRELAYRGQSVGVSQLLQGRNAGDRLARHARLGLDQRVTRCVHLGRELSQLVARREFDRPAEVPASHAPRLVDQGSHGSADQPRPE